MNKGASEHAHTYLVAPVLCNSCAGCVIPSPCTFEYTRYKRVLECEQQAKAVLLLLLLLLLAVAWSWGLYVRIIRVALPSLYVVVLRFLEQSVVLVSPCGSGRTRPDIIYSIRLLATRKGRRLPRRFRMCRDNVQINVQPLLQSPQR